MAWFLTAIGLFAVVMGCLALIGSPWFIQLARGMWALPYAVWVAVTLRVLVGVLVFFAADASRIPQLTRAVGVVFLISGLSVPFVGHQRIGRLIDRLEHGGPAPKLIWGTLAVAVGVMFLYLGS